MKDFSMSGKTYTIAYEPVILQGKHFLTLYLNAPHNLASNVALAIVNKKILARL